MKADPHLGHSEAADSHDEQVKKLGELVKDIRICMFTTIDADGRPWSRPMAAQAQVFDGDLWFFTGADSEKVARLQANPNVGVAFAKPGDQEYVTFAGSGRVVDDKAKAKELWAEPLRTWFPKGLDDPNLRLIKVEVDRAEYWDSPSSAIIYALGYAKARLTGKPPGKALTGENEKVDL